MEDNPPRHDATGKPRFVLPHKVLFGALGAVVLVVLGIGIGIAILLSGALSTAATQQHAPLTHWLLENGLRYSVSANAEGIVAPPLDDPAMLARGLSCFRVHCVQCHGAPGIAPGEQARGMMPVPANLAQSARDWPAEWLYYVTRKGVRMTGMPAWEFRLSDNDLWSTVAFLKSLPGLTRSQYQVRSDAAGAPSCAPDREPVAAPDPERVAGVTPVSDERAHIVLRQYACHSCHRIQGMVGPQVDVGPPLADWAARKYIAGTLPNTPENLIRWILAPQQVSPQTLMPDMQVSEAHAREMAGYLFQAD